MLSCTLSSVQRSYSRYEVPFPDGKRDHLAHTCSPPSDGSGAAGDVATHGSRDGIDPEA
jgi:hypothetical protein